ncbi:hypothetical protein [Planktothrix agardhii]|jgi:hypothetical protein|uniref:hypothetical protein n=1 Tax=Planktothrix agardhii TaxID=1160 RepID=UPI001F18BC78|nr:hypothetical protein [Planktothrix agardhii]MCF3578547.1 hypothetical protein [Planktothrix agardhii 1812]MCF3583310.1 hypothetical protein [Planktothrix agardhii 1811]
MRRFQGNSLKLIKINYKVLIVQLQLSLLIGSCNFINGVPNLRNTQSSSISQENLEEARNLVNYISDLSIQSLSFNNNFCGDNLTRLQSEFPIVVYPVVIDMDISDIENSKQLLEEIKLLSCSFIIKQEKEERQIMLALFTNKERAKNFILSSRIPKARVGNPVRIEHPPDAEVAQLGQINTSLVSWLIYIGAEKEKLFKIIVPTHIPPNFSLASINITFGQYRSYKLSYQGINGECFSMEGRGWDGGAGGDFSRFQQIDIKSDIFRTEKFIYGEGHDNKSFFSSAMGVMLIDDNSISKSSIEGSYDFISPPPFRFSSDYSSDCKVLAVPELVKIFKSMKYLN